MRPSPTNMTRILGVLAVAACVATTPRVHDDRPAEVSAAAGTSMSADRLFFGRSIPGGGSVTDEEWAAFLAGEITPRFPRGLTVWKAEGQWADPEDGLVREAVMVVEVVHPAGSRPDPELAAIAQAYKRRFKQDAVLRVTTPAMTRIYE